MADELAAFRRLHSRGVHFVANIPTVYGGQDLFLSPEDLLVFEHDRDAVAAKHLGVSRHVYVEWLASGGDVQCAGQTQAGRRCRNSISGGSIYDAAEWARTVERQERCALHGGLPGGTP